MPHTLDTCQRFDGWLAHCFRHVQLCALFTGWPHPAILCFIGANPLDHVGDRISVKMCVYIPQNVPKPQRNWDLKNQNFDPSRLRPLVSRVIDSDARRLNTLGYSGLEYEGEIRRYKLDRHFRFQSPWRNVQMITFSLWQFDLVIFAWKIQNFKIILGIYKFAHKYFKGSWSISKQF